MSEYPVEFAEASESADFLPRLWAMRRAGYLMDEIHKNGQNKELVDEVTQLGKQYAIATPYTSLLVVEDTPQMQQIVSRELLTAGFTMILQTVLVPVGMSTVSARRQWRRLPDEGWWRLPSRSAEVSFERNAPKTAGASSEVRPLAIAIDALQKNTGEEAVKNSMAMRDLKETAKKQTAQQQVRQLANRSYTQQGTKWVDTQYDGKKKTQQVVFGSDEYFKLMQKSKEIAKILALGQNVIFEWEGEWYEIVEKV